MTELVVCLSSEQDMWNHIKKLILAQDWDNVFMIADINGKNNFKSEKKTEFIVVDFNMPVSELIKDMQRKLKEKIKGIEVAVNLVSGNGKQHMAIISALLKLGVGIRFVALTKDGLQEL